ncbi:putative coiled-coil protein SlyX [Arthrobacter sp. B1I2]|nr:putative coiled-coil protein SlyX [Arthrobacter sp. B1I2]
MPGTQTYAQMITTSGALPTGSHSPRGYRYRGVPRQDAAASRTEELLGLLVQQRKMIALRNSRLRALSCELNELIAQAICDGVKVAAVALASGLPTASVRTTVLARDDLFPSGQSRTEQLRCIAALAAEVAEVESVRDAIERKRTEVLALARKSGLLDDYQLACASGLKHDEIRKMTRGISSRNPG